MPVIDLANLKPTDVPLVLDAVHRFLLNNGVALLADNVFMKPEHLAKRWELSLSCLSHWRLTGGGPLYMKTGPGPKAKVRYPMLGKNGVLDFESQRIFISTSEETKARSQSINAV